MNLFVLKAVAELFSGFQKVAFVGRVDDNLLRLRLENLRDLSRDSRQDSLKDSRQDSRGVLPKDSPCGRANLANLGAANGGLNPLGGAQDSSKDSPKFGRSQDFFISLEKSKSTIFCIEDLRGVFSKNVPQDSRQDSHKKSPQDSSEDSPKTAQDSGLEANLFAQKTYEKTYRAPFDVALQKYCVRAEILSAETDGNNRILRLFLRKNLDYKALETILQLEFTGKYTNAIILSPDFIVLEALRKVAQNSRVVKNGVALAPLKQQDFVPKALDFGDDLGAFLRQNYENLFANRLENAKKSALSQLENRLENLQKTLENLPKNAELNADSRRFLGYAFFLQNHLSQDFQKDLAALFLREFEGDGFAQEAANLLNEKPATRLMGDFFATAKNLARRAKNIALQEENLAQNLAFLEAKIDIIKNATSLAEIEIITQKNAPKSLQKKKENTQFESFFIDGLKVSIGKNQTQNLALLQKARGEDIWMHVRGLPSAHLIVHCAKNTPKISTLECAARLLVGFLKAKSGTFVVDYAKRKFVKITHGANVNYANYASFSVKKA